MKRSKINQLLASFIGRVFYKKKGNQLRKDLRFIITIFYCIAILIFQMSQLASTLAVHKSSYNGQFNYGRNFYAKDADTLNIMLPTKNNEIDFTYMELLISAIKKLVIKDVVLYADKKIEATKKVISKN